MQVDKRPVAREDIEKHLLRFLCASAEEVMARRTMCDRLSTYPWLDADHQVLFETIGDLLLTVPCEIVSHLPAALTRRGFPDLSCDFLHEPCTLDTASALTLAEGIAQRTSPQ